MWSSLFLAVLIVVAQDASILRGHSSNCRLIGWSEQGPQWGQVIEGKVLDKQRPDEVQPLTSRVLRFGKAVEASRSTEVWLVDGTRIVSEINELTESEVVLAENACGIQRIPMEWILGIDLSSYATLHERLAFGSIARECAGTDDFVIRVRGEPLRGQWLAETKGGAIIGQQAVQIRMRRGTDVIAVPLNTVRGLVPSPALRNPTAQSARYRIILDDGCDLAVVSLNAKGKGTLACGLEVQIANDNTKRDPAWWHRIVGFVERGDLNWVDRQSAEGFVQQNMIGESIQGALRDVNEVIIERADYVGESWPALQGIVMPARSQAAFRGPERPMDLRGCVSVIETKAIRDLGNKPRVRFRILSGASVRELREEWVSPFLTATDQPLAFSLKIVPKSDKGEIVVWAVEAEDATGVAAMGVWQDARYEETVEKP